MADDVDGARFVDVEMKGAFFEDVDLTGARLSKVNLNGARLNNVYFEGALLRGLWLVDAEIDGEIRGLTINGVDVEPLIEAELNRRDPDRAKMKPTDPEGFRDAWDIIERRWEATVARARRLDPELLHERVEGEWSFIETLRHLVFATDAWIRRAMLGDPQPWDALGLPFDEMEETSGVPWDRDARPSLDEVLALRADRMGTMRQVLADLTEEQLASDTTPVLGPGWPQPVSHPVRRCVGCIINEEWLHREFAERDLAILESAPTPVD